MNESERAKIKAEYEKLLTQEETDLVWFLVVEQAKRGVALPDALKKTVQGMLELKQILGEGFTARTGLKNFRHVEVSDISVKGKLSLNTDAAEIAYSVREHPKGY